MTSIAGRLGATRLTVPAAVVALAVNALGLVLLVPEYGAQGAALALVIAYVVLLVVLDRLTRRYFPVHFDWRRIGLAIVICGATCLLAGPLAPAPDLGCARRRAPALLLFTDDRPAVAAHAPAARARRGARVRPASGAPPGLTGHTYSLDAPRSLRLGRFSLTEITSAAMHRSAVDLGDVRSRHPRRTLRRSLALMLAAAWWVPRRGCRRRARGHVSRHRVV